MAMNDSSTQVDHSACAAGSCPMLATNSRGTTGDSDWLCFIHFSAAPKDWHHITAELNRLAWLVNIVRGLRALPIAKNWPEFEIEARKAINLSQRGDMNQKDSESTAAWMIRLEGILAQSCKDSLVQAQYIFARLKAPNELLLVQLAGTAWGKAGARPTDTLDLTTNEYTAMRAGLKAYFRALPRIERNTYLQACNVADQAMK
jgi:hypothetical protein